MSKTVDIKYVQNFSDRHGSERAYFRRKGFTTYALRTPIGSPEFWLDYHAAAAGKIPPGLQTSGKPKAPKIAKSGSFAWLCLQYKKSAQYKMLEPKTATTRSGLLDRIIEDHGDKPYALLTKKHISAIRDKHSHVPGTANNMVKAIRQVYEYACDMELVEVNPAWKIPSLHSGNGFHPWTLGEVQRYEDFHAEGTKARMTLALLLYTCQRRSDIVQLGRQHEHLGRLEFTQFKGRKKHPIRLSIPIISELRRILDLSPTGDMTYLVTSFNKPFTANGFGSRFRKWCDEAGLPHCSAHGLRKASAARMAELGCSDHEIMSIGGWTTLKEVQRYTKSARQKVLADSAGEKMEAGQKSNKSVKP